MSFPAIFIPVFSLHSFHPINVPLFANFLTCCLWYFVLSCTYNSYNAVTFPLSCIIYLLQHLSEWWPVSVVQNTGMPNLYCSFSFAIISPHITRTHNVVLHVVSSQHKWLSCLIVQRKTMFSLTHFLPPFCPFLYYVICFHATARTFATRAGVTGAIVWAHAVTSAVLWHHQSSVTTYDSAFAAAILILVPLLLTNQSNSFQTQLKEEPIIQDFELQRNSSPCDIGCNATVTHELSCYFRTRSSGGKKGLPAVGKELFSVLSSFYYFWALLLFLFLVR